MTEGMGSLKLDILMGMHDSTKAPSLVGTVNVPLGVGINFDGTEHLAVLTLPDNFAAAIRECVEAFSAALNSE